MNFEGTKIHSIAKNVTQRYVHEKYKNRMRKPNPQKKNNTPIIETVVAITEHQIVSILAVKGRGGV